MFYPDSHHGDHKCDTYLGPCPGPKPDDYILVRRGQDGHGQITIITHYINHGNTWQPAAKKVFTTPWTVSGGESEWDYLVLDENDLDSFGKDKP